jgi:parallel beta-helix repeat protein
MQSIRRAFVVALATSCLTAASLVAPARAGAIAATCANVQSVLDNTVAGDVVVLDGLCTPSSPITLPARTITLTGALGTVSGFDGSSLGDTPTVVANNVQQTRIEGLRFMNGSNTGGGAAISVTGASYPQLVNNSFFNNHATGSTSDGGAIKITQTTTPGPATLVANNTIGGATPAEGNSAGRDGGGIVLFGCSNVTFRNNTVQNNVAGRDGGGAYIYTANFVSTDPNVTVQGNTVRNNTAGAHGGGLSLFGLANGAVGGTTATLSANTVTGNEAGTGGGGIDVFLQDQKLLMTNTTISNNTVTGTGQDPSGGGALMTLYNGEVSSPNSMFIENRNRYIGNTVESAAGNGSAAGGGLFVTGISHGALNLYRNLYKGNRVLVTGGSPGTEGHGGAIAIDSPMASGMTAAGVRVFNSVFVGNQVTGQGGGISTDCFGGCKMPLRITNSTLFGNFSRLVPGISRSAAGTIQGNLVAILSVSNSIVFNPETGADMKGFGSRTTRQSIVCGTNGAPAGAGNMCRNPKLADPLAGNVRQTSRSPGINEGDTSLYPRPVDRVYFRYDYFGKDRVDGRRIDIGAHEKQQ